MIISPVSTSIEVIGVWSIVAGILAASTEMTSEKTPSPHLLTAWTLNLYVVPAMTASETVYVVVVSYEGIPTSSVKLPLASPLSQ